MQEVSTSGEGDTPQTGPATAHKGSSTPITVFILLCIISFLNYMDRNVLNGAVNTIAHELHFSLDGVGYLSSAFLIVYTLGTLPLSLWADRSQRKNIVALSVAVWSVATALTAAATNFITLFCARMLLGIGEAGYFPAGTALLSDCYNREQRSQVMARWSAAQYLGILGGFGIGGALAGLFFGGWRVAFLLTGIPGLIVAFLMWRVREPRRNQADEEAAARAGAPAPVKERQLQRIPFWSLCKQLAHIKSLIVLTVMQTFSFFVFSVCIAFLPTYLQQHDTMHMSSSMAGIYSGAIVVLGGLVGTLGSGYLSDFIERYHSGARVLTSGLVLLTSAPLLGIALLVHNIYIFTVLLFVVSALLCAFNGPSTAASQDVVPYWLRSSSSGFMLLLSHLFGDAISPSLVGIIATNLDPTHGAHFAAGIAGHELGLAIIVTCVPAIFIAGLVGIIGARYMHQDVVNAEHAVPPFVSEVAPSL